jgi:hypothetical protein
MAKQSGHTLPQTVRIANFLADYFLLDFFFAFFLALVFLATVFFFSDFLATLPVFAEEAFFFFPADFFFRVDFFFGDCFGRSFFLSTRLLLFDIFFLLLAKMLSQFSEYCSVAPTRMIDILVNSIRTKQ